MTERLEQIAAQVEERFNEKVSRVPSSCGELTFDVVAAELVEVCTVLCDEEPFRFNMLMDVCGIDYLEYGRAEWTTEDATDSGFSRGVDRDQKPTEVEELETPRFAAVYHLLSIDHNTRLRLRAFCPDDQFPVLDSVTGVWNSANWFEREAFDLYGILFANHPDLRRILTDYGFIGHPFRKDFPLTGNVEVRYDPEKGRVVYQPVTIAPRTLVPKVIREDNRYQDGLNEELPGDA